MPGCAAAELAYAVDKARDLTREGARMMSGKHFGASCSHWEFLSRSKRRRVPAVRPERGPQRPQRRNHGRKRAWGGFGANITGDFTRERPTRKLDSR